MNNDGIPYGLEGKKKNNFSLQKKKEKGRIQTDLPTCASPWFPMPTRHFL